MSELWHIAGGDLALSATGDLLTADGITATTQRIIRRLITNPGAYIWHLSYGGGLRRMVGEPGDARAITAIVRGQIFREASVARTPAPTVEVTLGATGRATALITYTYAPTGQSVSFVAPLGA